MEIRNANLKDYKIIAENNLKLAKESENKIISYSTVIEGVKNVLNDRQKGFYLVVEENKEIIGQIMITFEWSDWKNTNIWWLQSVYIKKSFRKKGLFKKMFNYIKKVAVENNVDTLRLYVHNNNVNAKKAYSRMNLIKKDYDFYQIEITK